MTRAALRRAIGPAVLLALAALLLFPLALGRSFWLRDMLLFTYPLKSYLRERLLGGALPLWNPRLGLGRPFFGVVQPGVLYPLNLVLLLPYPRGVDLLFALHLPIAALGLRAWLRARGHGEVAATFGGALYALSGYFVSQLVGSGSYAVGAAWLPWALAAVARVGFAGDSDAAGAVTVAPRRIARAIAGVGLFVALMILGGDPQAAWLAGGLALVEAAVAPRRRLALAVAAAGLALAALVAAVQLGPALEAASVGRPGGVPLADAAHFSFPPVRLVELWWPSAFGPPYGADWLLHPLYDEGTGWAYEPWSAGIYLGLATPLLAAAALATRRPRARDLAWSAVAVAALLVACGRHAPLFALFRRVVPGARLFRYPEKYWLVVTLALCALAPAGLLRALARPRRALVVGAAALVLLAVGWLWAAHAGGAFVVAALGRLEHGTPAEAGAGLAAAARAACLVGAATLLPIALAAAGRLSPSRASLALAAIVVADLFAASARLTRFVPSSLYRDTPAPIAAMRAAAGPALVRFYRPQYLRFDAPDVAPAALSRATLRPDCGIDDGAATLDAYDSFALPDEQALWRALERRPLRLLEVTATPFALLPAHLYAARDGFAPLRAWPALHAVLAHVTAPAPRVYLAADARVAPDADAARLLAGDDFVPGRSVVLAPAPAAAPAHAGGDCVLADDRAERLVLRCRADAPSYAVVADAWYPGWSATVDGRAAPLVRANLAERAVPVPAGDHEVVLAYRPAHLVTGAALSIAGLAAALALALGRRRRARG